MLYHIIIYTKIYCFIAVIILLFLVRCCSVYVHWSAVFLCTSIWIERTSKRSETDGINSKITCRLKNSFFKILFYHFLLCSLDIKLRNVFVSVFFVTATFLFLCYIRIGHMMNWLFGYWAQTKTQRTCGQIFVQHCGQCQLLFGKHGVIWIFFAAFSVGWTWSAVQAQAARHQVLYSSSNWTGDAS